MFNLSLTRAILKQYFNINYFDMPPSHLVPPVPNRHSYILWIDEVRNKRTKHSEERSNELEELKYVVTRRLRSS